MFFDGPQNPKSLKYWADDEGWFMSGLFYSTKILLKNLIKGQFAQNLKMDLRAMNMSKYQKPTLGGPMAK